ncbi:hypothetical protein L211DRAFT_474702 [Terfezia boudieri ATCC MYA-4762]|uniref:Uncharacterized protein n=1 Tax=Terfezia boudieri ATCC MYA-4762 TaxID=1051890 RepID=A0A3N4MGG8_9PEZI|nr:hypothetical protein L211DRAFT_474702 [Terfezia boudieri ATCC MYA-4762]
MLFPQRCRSQFIVTITLLCIYAVPALSEKLDTTNLTLVETTYNSTLSPLESDANSTKYTLSQFLSNVVVKTGFSTVSTTDEDQNLKYYQTGFLWNPDEDADSSYWQPLAVSTWQDTVFNGSSAELDSVDNSWKGVMVVSWKDTVNYGNGGVKVSFVVNGTGEEGAQRKYSHVLLVNNVAKKAGGVTFDTINATNVRGGMVWYGGWLYLGDGKTGIRAFDVSNIWKVDSKDAFGMEYILPQARMYNPSSFPARYRSFTFDIMSIDRNSTPPCLLVSNYEGSSNKMSLLAKWPLDGTNGRLATKTADGKLVALASWAYRMSILAIRGMVFAHKKYYIGQLAIPTSSVVTGDMNELGRLWLWAPGDIVDPIEGVLPRGVGGLAYSPDGDIIWAVAAIDGSRGVVGINAGAYVGYEPSVTKVTSTTSVTTINSPTTSPPFSTETGMAGSKTNTGAIVGGVIGGIAAGAFLLWILLMYRRRNAARGQPTSQRADQYPPPGFAQGTEEFYRKGEIPMLKSELDATLTQVNHAAAVTRSTGSKEHVEALDEWEKKKAVSRMPARKPVPMATPAAYDSVRGEGPWVELPAIEKPVQAP